MTDKVVHPSSVSKSGQHTTAATDYTPAEHLASGVLAGLTWGQRVCFIPSSAPQFMVYDKDRRNVLSCGPTPEHAAYMARQRIERESLPPSHFNARLVGCRFDKDLSLSKTLLTHCVIDAKGVTLGRSVDGRQEAVKEAVRSIVSRLPVSEITLEEHELIAFAQPIIRNMGKGYLPAVYANDAGGVIQRALGMMWNQDPALQGKHPDRVKFLRESQSELLTHVGKQGGDISSLTLTDSSDRTFHFVFHSSLFGSAQALEIDFLQAGGVRDAHEFPVIRERGAG